MRLSPAVKRGTLLQEMLASVSVEWWLRQSPDDERGVGDVLQPQVARVELVDLAGEDLHRHGHVGEVHPHQRETGIHRLDARHALAIERGIHQQELPDRARCGVMMP